MPSNRQMFTFSVFLSEIKTTNLCILSNTFRTIAESYANISNKE